MAKYDVFRDDGYGAWMYLETTEAASPKAAAINQAEASETEGLYKIYDATVDNEFEVIEEIIKVWKVEGD